MKNKGWTIKFSLVLLVAACCASAFGTTSPDDAVQLRWLAAGAFPSEGSNALFKDYLAQGETNLRAKAGEAAGKNSSNPARWQQASAAPDGSIDFSKIFPNNKRAVAYAYAEINAPTAQTLAATIGSRSNIQVRLNGEIILESRLSRKPEPDKDALVLPLRKGLNTILVKMEGGGSNWKLQLTMHQPTAKFFVNGHNTIIPDFRANEAVAAWGQIEIANASNEELKNVTVEAVGDDLIYPSRSESISLKPAEIGRVPVWINAKRAANQTGEKPIRLRLTANGAANGAEQFTEFKPRVRRADGYFVTTYRSAVDGSVQPYSVFLPPSFSPEKTYPLILLLHGAHVTDWAQNIIAYDAKDWAIQIAVHDRGNNRYRDIGEVDIDEVLAEVKRRYRIDSDRIYLAGHSMGGYGTWFQATHRPDLWASISPQAGYSDYTLYLRGESAKLQKPFQKRLLESWSPLNFAENLLHVPAYVVHGAKDDNVSVEHSRKMTARLKELGYKFDYFENPEGGHWWGPRGKNYGTEIVDNPKIWDFLRQTKQRADAPRKVIFKTDSLHYRKAYWVTIDELEKANQMSRIEAEITAPNQISVKLENVKQLTLNLNEKLVETNRPVTIKINNRTAFQGELPNSNRLTIRTEEPNKFVRIFDKTDLHLPENSAERFENLAAELDTDGQVTRFFERENARLQKTPEIYGRISDAFNTPFLLVVGTRGRDAKSIALNKAANRAAEMLVREWMMRASGGAEIKRDVDVISDDINSRNLILFGNANTNAIIAEINGKLPVKFEGANLVANGQKIFGEDLGMILIAPNPLQTNRYAVIVGGTTPRSFETASRLNFNELPDFVLFDNRTLTGEKIDFVGGGFFNKFWELDEMSQIGRGK